MTASNAELAYRVLDHIDAHPERHDQSDFVRSAVNTPSITADRMPCGTTACFAGWTVLLSGHEIDLRRFMPRADVGDGLIEVDDVAARLLGIGESGLDGHAHRLFYEANSRKDLGRMVAEIFGPRPGGEA